MESRTVTTRKRTILLVAVGTLALLIVVLVLLQPSPWVHFAFIWSIPVVFGLCNLILPDRCFGQSTRENWGYKGSRPEHEPP